MTAHNFVFDILLPIWSVVGTSDDLQSYQCLSQYVLIALHYQLSWLVIWIFSFASKIQLVTNQYSANVHYDMSMSHSI